MKKTVKAKISWIPASTGEVSKEKFQPQAERGLAFKAGHPFICHVDCGGISRWKTRFLRSLHDN